MIIYGKNILLRGIEESDNEMLRGMLNDPETEYYTTGWHFPLSKKNQHDWFVSFYQTKENQRWVIETLNTHEAVGLIILHDIDYKNGSASYGIKLSPNGSRGKGYATDAELAMMTFAFEELRLHKLNSSVLEYNLASIKMTENCGAKREGLRRETVFKNGKYHNEILYGVLYEDYLEARERNNWEPAVIRKA